MNFTRALWWAPKCSYLTRVKVVLPVECQSCQESSPSCFHVPLWTAGWCTCRRLFDAQVSKSEGVCFKGDKNEQYILLVCLAIFIRIRHLRAITGGIISHNDIERLAL